LENDWVQQMTTQRSILPKCERNIVALNQFRRKFFVHYLTATVTGLQRFGSGDKHFHS